MNTPYILSQPTSLGEQSVGFQGHIVAPLNGSVPWRLRELGFVPGTPVRVLRRGPLGDPFELELRGYRICLRRSDLELVRVQPLTAAAR